MRILWQVPLTTFYTPRCNKVNLCSYLVQTVSQSTEWYTAKIRLRHAHLLSHYHASSHVQALPASGDERHELHHRQARATSAVQLTIHFLTVTFHTNPLHQKRQCAFIPIHNPRMQNHAASQPHIRISPRSLLPPIQIQTNPLPHNHHPGKIAKRKKDHCFFFPAPFLSASLSSISLISASSLLNAYHCPACNTNTPTNTSANMVLLAANTLSVSSLLI